MRSFRQLKGSKRRSFEGHTGLLESMGRTAAGKARASVKTACASVNTAVFTHRSFAIVRVSAKKNSKSSQCAGAGTASEKRRVPP